MAFELSLWIVVLAVEGLTLSALYGATRQSGAHAQSTAARRNAA
ncbi:MAG: hypothetical protein V2I65_15180 [Paracoccaceae bacterium]|nr:hypothetical protein [Paracoccaceae bacterium]